ncbi:lipopolysaccharide export system ATP-binding protein LptB [Acidobacteriota bacterium]|nr:lipopolysaccharide export system ATP-binding protein LptB [Acidobacteriota bacterium]
MTNPHVPSKPVLSIRNLRKSYEGHPVVKDVSLEIGPGEIVGLLGPNGAGKTTTFYMIVGIESPDEGSIFWNNIDISSLPMHKRAQLGIAYLPQESSIFRGLTVRENIMAIAELLAIQLSEQKLITDKLIESFRLSKVENVLGRQLSGGERRRCELARALVSNPKVMLLDEPFAGIDPKSIDEIHELIYDLKARGIGVLITDHNVRETLQIAERAYILVDGVIFRSGTPQEIAADPDIKKVYLGEGFSLA